ncbi:MAG: type II secretion system protein [Phycisphaerales bacterium]|nr:type II secretion system protein [Phycisphaerales bacterium]
MTMHTRRIRGWVLLEMILALTIFIFTALTVLGSIAQGIAAAERTRSHAQAVDLARSTMAKLEAGLGTMQNLAGPVPAWEPDAAPTDGADGPGAGGFSDTAPPPSLWEVEIDSLPSPFSGLTQVTVTVVKRPAPDSERVVASYSLHQLVHLLPERQDSVGETDPITTEGARGGRFAPTGGSR